MVRLLRVLPKPCDRIDHRNLAERSGSLPLRDDDFHTGPYDRRLVQVVHPRRKAGAEWRSELKCVSWRVKRFMRIIAPSPTAPIKRPVKSDHLDRHSLASAALIAGASMFCGSI